MSNTVKITNNYMKCQENHCKKELHAVDSILHKFNALSTKLAKELDKGRISETKYDTQMKKLNISLEETKEKLAMMKCNLQNCEKESRAFLQTFIEDAKVSCKTKPQCKQVSSDLKKTRRGKINLDTYKKLSARYI